LSPGERRAAGAAVVVGTLGALGLGGCMRIYPDPELPDVVVKWDPEFTCEEDDERVVVSLSSIEPAAEVGTATVPCGDGSVRFEDVARIPYRALARLEDQAGVVLGGDEREIDLRDGISEQIDVFFGRLPESNLRVEWAFDMGASCQTLGASRVVALVREAGGGTIFFFDAPCRIGVLNGSIHQEGTYTVRAWAIADENAGAVAVSPPSAPFAVIRGATSEPGTLTLSPCSACPPI
jgi:hypothetical protein